jgi:uncharacterized protein YfiM (DUF2279 family)
VNPNADSWLGRDKALHLGLSAAFPLAGLGMGALLGHPVAGLWAGLGVGAVAGAAKEMRDAAGYGTASWRDVAADAAGLVLGAALGWALLGVWT